METDEKWGVLMRADDELAKKDRISPADLMNRPLIISEQAEFIKRLSAWAGSSYSEYTVCAAYNLIYNASLMVQGGVGYAIGYGSILDTCNTGLVFRQLSPELRDGMCMIWKGKPLTKAASLFLECITEDDSD